MIFNPNGALLKRNALPTHFYSWDIDIWLVTNGFAA
jgi:hypothetical protein